MIFESDLNLENRLFVLLSCVALLAMVIIFIVGALIGETFTDLLMLGGAIVIAALLSVIAIRKTRPMLRNHNNKVAYMDSFISLFLIMCAVNHHDHLCYQNFISMNKEAEKPSSEIEELTLLRISHSSRV